MDWLSALMSVGGGLAADGAAAPDREQARRLIQKMMEEYGGINAPTLEAPEAQQLGDTALGGVETDPRFKEAQEDSLGALKQMQDGGGLLLDDKVALNKIQNQLARREAAGRSSIANDFASRGQLGSGAQLAMSMGNQQDSANRAADAGANTAAAAQRRYFDSVLQRGKMAGDMSSEEYRRKADAARARDSIAAHNAAARTDAARYKNSVGTQDFSNRMSLAGGRSGAGYKQANYLSDEASRKAETIARATAGASKALSSDDDEDEDN